MLRKILWVLVVVVLLFSISIVYSLITTRNHSPSETVSIAKQNVLITVNYCRPFKKGRKIFGGLLPYDTYWRTGANDPTIITFSKDVQFNGEPVKAGSYRIYTIPGEEVWTVALNTELEKWGYWEPDYDLDVVRAKVMSSKTREVQEQFLISLREADISIQLALHWDSTRVSIPINF